jgi:hypothetical protein
MERDVDPAEPDEVEPAPEIRSFDPETPEADAIEQMQAVVPLDLDDEVVTLPPDVSEADALDQLRVVVVDDEGDWSE